MTIVWMLFSVSIMKHKQMLAIAERPSQSEDSVHETDFFKSKTAHLH